MEASNQPSQWVVTELLGKFDAICGRPFPGIPPWTWRFCLWVLVIISDFHHIHVMAMMAPGVVALGEPGSCRTRWSWYLGMHFSGLSVPHTWQVARAEGAQPRLARMSQGCPVYVRYALQETQETYVLNTVISWSLNRSTNDLPLSLYAYITNHMRYEIK